MGRDSNPRYLAVHTLSRRAQSTALAPIQEEPETLRRLWDGFNLFSLEGQGRKSDSTSSHNWENDLPMNEG
jgi:hypothetical protein